MLRGEVIRLYEPAASSPLRCSSGKPVPLAFQASIPEGPAGRVRMLARVYPLVASGGSANAIMFPSGSGMFTWRTPFE